MAKAKKKAAAPKKKAAPKKTAAPKAKAKAKPKAKPKPKPKAKPKKKPVTGAGEVVRMVESSDPIDALRKYLGAIKAGATVQQGQVTLGSAQLMLLPLAREGRGGDQVKELLDVVLSRWSSFPDRTG